VRKSFLSYLGGKSLLANKIIPLIPEHVCYCEVFAGAAWLLFKKEESEVEILNDINTDEFVRYLRWLLVSRDEFARFKAESPETLTDIQRAVRFYYLLRNGYAAKVDRPTFSIGPTNPPRFNLLRIEEDLSAAHLRLSRVYIENLHFQKIIERFDRPATFFYLDPPYYNCEEDYGKGIFHRDDFERLADILKGLEGKFMLSINDTKEIRGIFKAFEMKKVQTTYTAAGADRKKEVGELLFMNFDPKKSREP
jgi:DNA adenine methylase